MAGEWIKMRGNLWDDPRVARIVDMTDSSEAAVVGALYWLWSTADQHTETGHMAGLTLKAIDRKTGVTGFAKALCDINWIQEVEDGILIVDFEKHNGTSAKKRSQTAKRVANHTAANAKITPTDDKTNAVSVSDALAREEKRREEKRDTGEGESAVAPPTPKPAKPIAVEKPDDVEQQVWSDWLTLRKAKKAPATQTVVNSAITEADKAGMPLNDFLAVWCARGSQGLEASWLKPDERNHGKPSRQAETFAERDERLAADRIAAICPSIAAKPINRNRDVIDITPRRFGALS